LIVYLTTGNHSAPEEITKVDFWGLRQISYTTGHD